MTAKILAISGSARRDSVNGRLLAAAVAAARAAGAEVTVVDHHELALPLYDGDLEAEAGLPDNAKRLKALFASHQGLLIASPEYNGFFTPLLKNLIDWVSRPVAGVASPFAGKTAAIVAASPGGLGGLRGLPHIRLLLSNLGVTVLPGQLALGTAHEAFGHDGKLRDGGQQATLEGIAGELARVTAALNA